MPHSVRPHYLPTTPPPLPSGLAATVQTKSSTDRDTPQQPCKRCRASVRSLFFLAAGPLKLPRRVKPMMALSVCLDDCFTPRTGSLPVGGFYTTCPGLCKCCASCSPPCSRTASFSFEELSWHAACLIQSPLIRPLPLRLSFRRATSRATRIPVAWSPSGAASLVVKSRFSPCNKLLPHVEGHRVSLRGTIVHA